MTLVDRVVAGFKAQFLSKIIASIAGAILITALARLLQPDGYGLLMLALTIFGTFKLVARLGIGGSAGRYVAEFKETKPEQILQIVRFSFLLAVAAIGVTVVILLLSYQRIVSLFSEPRLAPFLLVGTVFLAIGTLRTYIKKVLQGFEKIQFIALMKLVDPVSRLVFVLAFVLAGFGALGAFVGYVLSALVTVAFGGGYLLYTLRSYRGTSSPMEPGLRRRITEYAIPLTATNSAAVLDKRVDTLLVGFFLSPVEVGFYVLADRVIKLLETPMSALGFTLSPMFGAEKAAGNVTEISRLYEKALLNSLLLYIPAGAGLILVAEPMVLLVFGSEYSGTVILLQVLGLYAVFKAVTKLTDNGLNYLGRARDRAIVRGITAVLNVGLNILFIPLFGVVGAAIATVITYGLYTAANLYIISLEFELRPVYLLQQLSVIVLITGAMSAVVFTLNGYISGWLTLILVVGTGGLIWGVLSVLTGMLEPKEVFATLS